MYTDFERRKKEEQIYRQCISCGRMAKSTGIRPRHLSTHILRDTFTNE